MSRVDDVLLLLKHLYSKNEKTSHPLVKFNDSSEMLPYGYEGYALSNSLVVEEVLVYVDSDLMMMIIYSSLLYRIQRGESVYIYYMKDGCC